MLETGAKQTELCNSAIHNAFLLHCELTREDQVEKVAKDGDATRHNHFNNQLLLRRCGCVRGDKQGSEIGAETATQALNKTVGGGGIFDGIAEVPPENGNALRLIDRIHDAEEGSGDEHPPSLMLVHVQGGEEAQNLHKRRNSNHGSVSKTVCRVAAHHRGNHLHDGIHGHGQAHLIHVLHLARDLGGDDHLAVAVVDKQHEQQHHSLREQTL